MKALIQRVSAASVKIKNKEYSSINEGLCVFLGVKKSDTELDVKYLVEKIINLRIFSDKNDKINKSIYDIRGSILIVSQFTLYANCKKGNRPSFIDSADKLSATPLYDLFVNLLRKKKINIRTGIFGSDMKINLINEGPVTIILESGK